MAEDGNKIDYKEKRAIQEEVDRATKINQDSLFENFMRIKEGKKPIYKSAEGSHPTGFIDTTADRPDENVEANHIDFDGLMSHMGYAAPIQNTTASMQSFSDINPLFDDITEFKFSSNREEEIAILREAIRQGKLVIAQQRQKEITNQVVENTKKASKGTGKFFRLKNGGLRVEFSLLGQKFSMIADGMLSENDCLYWQAEGENIIGHVLRLQNGQFNNISDNFNINIVKGWKSQ